MTDLEKEKDSGEKRGQSLKLEGKEEPFGGRNRIHVIPLKDGR